MSPVPPALGSSGFFQAGTVGYVGAGEPLGKTAADGSGAWYTAGSANRAGTGLCQRCGCCG